MFRSDEIEKICQQPLANNEEAIEFFIMTLKKADSSLILTMRILMEKLSIKLREARDLTLNSSAWIEHKQAFYEFNDIFLNAVDEWNENT